MTWWEIVRALIAIANGFVCFYALGTGLAGKHEFGVPSRVGRVVLAAYALSIGASNATVINQPVSYRTWMVAAASLFGVLWFGVELMHFRKGTGHGR